jgi:hypothetical protein
VRERKGKSTMFEVIGSVVTIKVATLEEAMQTAKMLNEFVTIKGNGMEIVGMFGADTINEGVLPNGFTYEWKKRRI